MLKLKILVYIFLFALFISITNAATIYGSIYDLSLKKVNNARVEINTLPKQFLVAQNGTYAFNVPNGAYTIKAQLLQKNTIIASVQENITIKQDGIYVLDLILFPDIEEGIEDIDIDVNGNIVETEKNNFLVWFLILFILIIILIGAYFLKIKKELKSEDKKIKIEEKDEDNNSEQIIKIIKQEGGRATQKEIRKQLSLSETKISLMIAELEHKGLVEKIRKGRSNIIILRKR